MGDDVKRNVELEAKPTADVPLVGPEEHPIMISWQYGLGQVVTMATDAGPRWSGKWVEWDGYATFWTQMARWSLKRQEGAETGAQVTFDKAIAKIAIDVEFCIRRTFDRSAGLA